MMHRGPAQPEIPIGYERNFRSEFISDRHCLSDFPSEIPSDLIFDRILFPIGFPVGFSSTFRSDPIVFDQNFRSDILSEFWAGCNTPFLLVQRLSSNSVTCSVVETNPLPASPLALSLGAMICSIISIRKKRKKVDGP